MLGQLFVVFTLGIILAIVIGTVGDDFENCWRSILGMMDPNEQHFRELQRRAHSRR